MGPGLSTTPNSIPLDYAPPAAAGVGSRIWRLCRAAVTVFFSAALGAVIGLWLTPRTYQASWYFDTAASGPAAPAAVQGRPAPSPTYAPSDAVVDAVVADLNAGGATVPAGADGRAFIRRGLRVDALPNGRIVRFTFRSPDVTLPVSVVRAFHTHLPAQTGGQFQTIVVPTGVTWYRHPAGAIAGAILAAALVLTLLIRHHHRRGEPEDLTRA